MSTPALRYWTETDADLGPIYRTDSGDLVADVYVWRCSQVNGGQTQRELARTGKRALAMGRAS
jgi:hypothetical protein